MKVKIIEDSDYRTLEYKINQFVRDVQVIEIKYKIFNRNGICSNVYNAMIMYEETV